MTITLGAVFGPNAVFPGTSAGLSFGTVTAGQLVTFEVAYWNPVTDDPLVVGDVTPTGTAVLGEISIDRQDAVQADTAVWLRTAVYSARVTTGGTLTMTVAGLQAGSSPTVFGATFNSTEGWSDNPGRRRDGAGAGAATAANSLTSWSSGNASGSGTSALNSVFVGCLTWNAGVNAGLAITGGLFSSIGIFNDGTTAEPAAASYYIISTPTSAAASWSGTMAGAATEGASATLVSYREGTSPLISPATLAPDLRTRQRPPFLRRDPRRVAPDPFDFLGSRTGVEKWFAWELTVAGGAGSHPTSGALVADAATIAGTAAHFTLHATSGALAASAATLAGVAVHRTLHATTGALTAAAATIAGTAAHHHATTGALVASSATLAGTAAHLTLHTTSGALVSGAATIAGSAAHEHATTGALAASAATISGTADRTTGSTSHDTSGALNAADATISGAAAHEHATTGALVASSATLAGTAAHFTLHATSGALTAQDATIAGDAAVAGATHDTTGSLAAGDATIAGVAAHNVTHETSGALQATSATISGLAQLGAQILVIDTHDGAPKRDRQHKKKQEERRRAIEEAVNPPVPEVQAPVPDFQPIDTKAPEIALTSDNTADLEADDEAQILTMLAQIEDQALADFLDELSRRIRSIRPRRV